MFRGGQPEQSPEVTNQPVYQRGGQPEASAEAENQATYQRSQDDWALVLEKARQRVLTDPQFKDTWQNPIWVAEQAAAGLRHEVPWNQWNRWTFPEYGGLSLTDALNILDRLARGYPMPNRADAP